MFTKNLILSAVIALIPTVASAAPYPWKKTAKGITQSHKAMALQLKTALDKKGIKYPLSVDPFEARWHKKRRIEAISNVDEKNLKRLITGHYFVGTYLPWAKNTGKLGDNITVMYFSPSGDKYSCWGGVEKVLADSFSEWHIIKSYAGFGGIISDSKEAFLKHPLNSDTFGYSLAYAPGTGKALYYKEGKNWQAHEVFTGHYQKEYAPIFAQICPNLPKVGRVNEAQTSRKYSEFFKQGAKPIKGIPVVFNQDVDDPLTLEKYFTLYPPTAK